MSASLTLSVEAWAKWKFLCERADIEVTAFGIPSRHNPLYVDDLYVPPQVGAPAHTETDDGAMSDFQLDVADRYEEGDRGAEGIGRLWFHTHPEMSATPSVTDEKTFAGSFGSEWALMAILSKTGDVSAHLRVVSPTAMRQKLDVVVDWTGWAKTATQFPDLSVWRRELEERVRERPKATVTVQASAGHSPFWVPKPVESSDGSVLYMGHRFSKEQWESFNSQNYEPSRPAKKGKGGRGSKKRTKWTRPEPETEMTNSPWYGVEVMYEQGSECGSGRVVEDDGEGWLTVKDDVTGELVEVEDTDVTPMSQVYFGQGDVIDRLDERIDRVDSDALWYP